MKKGISEGLMLVIGILAFLLSYMLDVPANSLFMNVKFPILDAVLSIITNFGLVIIVSVLIPSIILYRKHKKAVFLLALTFAASFAAAFAIKLIVLRQRPIDAFTYPFTSIINYSFPSMHSMVVFSMLPALIKHLPRQKFFFIAFAFLVAFSRIYFGFHFLSDVVFGILFGYFTGAYLLKHFENKKWLK